MQIRALYNFSTKLYHPTKLIPQNKWLAEYALIFNKKPPSSTELQRQKLSRVLSITPCILYSCYWVMLGHFDILHCLGGVLFAGILIRSGYNRYFLHLHQIQQMYLNKDGKSWLAVMYSNQRESKSKLEKENLELRKILSIPNDMAIYRFDCQQIEEAETISQIKNAEQISFAIQKGLEDFKSIWYCRIKMENQMKEFYFDMSDNSLVGFDDYIEALMKKQFIQIRIPKA